MMKKESINEKDVITKLASDWFVRADKRNIIFDLGWIDIFEAGYKFATKVYTEEDIEKAFKAGQKFIATEGKIYPQSENFEEFIKSLNKEHET